MFLRKVWRRNREAAQFGGCIMLHAPLAGANMVTGRIEYVEVENHC